MKKISKVAGFSVFFVFAFCFFLFFTFPYEILKEALSEKISSMSGLNIRIGELGPSFPMGLSVENIVINSKHGAELKFKKVDASMSLLALLMGGIGADIVINSGNNDYLSIEGKLGILSLLIDNNFLPKKVNIKSQKFPIGGIVDFILAMEANSPTANPLVSPILKQINFSAKLQSDIKANLDVSDPVGSSGNLDISFSDAVLKMTDPSLEMPNQNFKHAKITAGLSKGVFTIATGSGLVSSDISLTVGGNVSLKQPPERSILAMDVGVELKGPLKEQFGFVMDAISGSQRDGKMSMKIGGTLNQPNVDYY
ncbi:MAG: type II secretion system protein GspN [Bdellovibrionota bacterium]